MTNLNNDFEALTEALYLAISAPSDEQAEEATSIAQDLAYGMSETEINRAKLQAIGRLYQ